MRKTLFILALLAALFAGQARAEDGAPPTPLVVCDVSIQLFDNEDYFGDARWECIKGGSGSNTIKGNGGRDTLEGQGGTDPIYGGDGQDIIYGGKEGDHLEGGTGDDSIYAGCFSGCDQSGAKFFNAVYGGDGDDIIGLRNDVNNDEAHCGSGFDIVYLDKRGSSANPDTADGSCEDVRRG